MDTIKKIMIEKAAADFVRSVDESEKVITTSELKTIVFDDVHKPRVRESKPRETLVHEGLRNMGQENNG